jgi:hypothetical protein
MVNPIAQIVMTDKTRQGASLQVVQLSQNAMSGIVFFLTIGLRDNLKLFCKSNSETRKSWSCHWFRYLVDLSSYPITLADRRASENSNSIGSFGVNFWFQSLARLRRDYWRYQRYTGQNQPESRKDLHVWWKLHKSNIGEYSYTSLELAENLGALMAYPRANFLSSHPVRIVRGKNNKEQCLYMASSNYS